MHNDKNKILSATLMVSAIILGVKIFGFIKQLVIAGTIGANIDSDVFFIGTVTIISMGYIIFASFGTTALAGYTRIRETDPQGALGAVNAMTRIVLSCTGILALAMHLFSAEIAWALAPFFSEEGHAKLQTQVSSMAPTFALVAVYYILNAILESQKTFAPGRLLFLQQNIFIILATLFLYEKMGVSALGFSIFVSVVLQCVLLAVCLGKRFFELLRAKPDYAEGRRMFFAAMPLIAYGVVSAVDGIVGKQICSGLGVGAASFLSYANSLNNFVIAIVVSSATIVLYPHFATWLAQKNTAKIEESMNTTVCVMILLLVPVAGFFITCSFDMADLLFSRGRLPDDQVAQTASAIAGYAAGFLFNGIFYSANKVLYAFERNRTVFWLGVAYALSSIAGAVLLSPFAGVAGVALGMSIGMTVSCVLSVAALKTVGITVNVASSLAEFAKVAAACAVAAVAVHFVAIENLYVRFCADAALWFAIAFSLSWLFGSTAARQALEILKSRRKTVAQSHPH